MIEVGDSERLRDDTDWKADNFLDNEENEAGPTDGAK